MALMILIVLASALTAVFLSLYCKATFGICKCSRHMVGKVVIVTGAHCGLGYATARDLADRGAKVIITSIDDQLGVKARDTIIEETENQQVIYHHLDLSSFASIRNFCDTILRTEQRLDVLINNAGVFISSNLQTKDGLLEALQINYFGPFLLTNLLLPLLKSSAPSRIINVASYLYKGKLDFKDINLDTKKFSLINVYGTSKLYVIAMTVEMARRLKDTSVTVNCLHPGCVNTDIAKKTKLLKMLISCIEDIGAYYVKTPWEGAQTTIYLAVSPDVKNSSGNMYKDCCVIDIGSQLKSKEIGTKLWDKTNEIVFATKNPNF